MTSKDARKAITPLFQKHRSKMNTPGGYWIFNGDPKAVEHARTGIIPLGKGGKLLLATDGFSRLVDLFEYFATWGDLLYALQKSSLQELGEILRDIETRDSECLKFPRFSTHDDATAVYMEIDL
jgi:hypothetical protein